MNIIDVQQAATKEADSLLRAATNLVDDVRQMLKAGSDTLTTQQIEEWLLVIPIQTINTKDREIDKSVMYYIRDRAGNMMDALHSLLMSLMKIYNSRMQAPREG